MYFGGRKASVDLINESYDDLDYSRFNSTFRDKYNQYETFLRDRGIVQHLNRKNDFLVLTDTMHFEEYRPNTDYFRKLTEDSEKHRILYHFIDGIKEIRNNL